MPTTKILARVNPCRCGCKGRDPGHARYFHRVIRDVEYVRGTARAEMETWSLQFDALGMVHMPWTDAPVPVARQVSDHGTILFWVLVRDVVRA